MTLESICNLCKLSLSKIMQVLGAFEFSLVKFDVGYPTGEKHKGFGSFALQSVGLPNLLAAEVRITIHLTLSHLHMYTLYTSIELLAAEVRKHPCHSNIASVELQHLSR